MLGADAALVLGACDSQRARLAAQRPGQQAQRSLHTSLAVSAVYLLRLLGA